MAKNIKLIAPTLKAFSALFNPFPPQSGTLQQEKPETFPENIQVARRGGKVAGNARKDTEKELGRSVISKENYLSDQLPDNEQNTLENK